jgi:nucleotide-binding universal stress UspA family protein
MFKHILLPTDGSELSRQAIADAVLFARNTGATLVGIHIIPPARTDRLEAWMHADPDYPKRRQALFEKFADEYLSYIANSAQAESVPCVCETVHHTEPYRAILETAGKRHCDLIYMASHGWGGDEATLLGSETLKVLHHSPVPVLVHKSPHKK